jgi:hypothetical protein
MGSACSDSKGAVVGPQTEVVPGGMASLPPLDGAAAAAAPRDDAAVLTSWVAAVQNRAPAAAPPSWGQLKTAERIALVKADAALALEALDVYWFNKVQKYVTGVPDAGKAPKLPCHGGGDGGGDGGAGSEGVSKRAEKQWKLMLRAQKDCNAKRMLIWEETQLSWWKQVEKTAGTPTAGSPPPSRRNGPAGMAALAGSKDTSAVGVSKKSSSSLTESQKTTDTKKQMEALAFLSTLIGRQRGMASLLKRACADMGACAGRQRLYKNAVDHLLALEEQAQPLRQAKSRVDQQLINLCKLQINAHEQQMRQWEAEQAKWADGGGGGGGDDDETAGLLAAEPKSNADNPAFG